MVHDDSCELRGHDWIPTVSPDYERCKWCKATRKVKKQPLPETKGTKQHDRSNDKPTISSVPATNTTP
jgi:hypothetical protein